MCQWSTVVSHHWSLAQIRESSVRGVLYYEAKEDVLVGFVITWSSCRNIGCKVLTLLLCRSRSLNLLNIRQTLSLLWLHTSMSASGPLETLSSHSKYVDIGDKKRKMICQQMRPFWYVPCPHIPAMYVWSFVSEITASHCKLAVNLGRLPMICKATCFPCERWLRNFATGVEVVSRRRDVVCGISL